jgi:serine/threonine-protein kinase HipA
MKEHRLTIAFAENTIGELIYSSEDDKFSLNYTQEWKETGFPLSPHLPLESTPNSNSIRKYLENQFPEGKGLEILLEEFRVGKNNIFRIIQIIGSETVGALTFIDPTKTDKQKTLFREVTAQELSERLDKRNEQGLVFWDGRPRLSVAGVQDKLPLTILPNGKMGLGEGELASTHILKFQKEDKKISYLVLNEYFCMKLAKLIGLNVAEVEFKKIGKHPTLLVKRFDREYVNDCLVKRFHVIDGCQALDLPSSYKYERNFGDGRDVADIRDGANLKSLFDFTNQCLVPATAFLYTLQWTIFNLCLSNSDSHGKNISYYINQNGINPAPIYDVVNIAVYPKVEQALAMSIGDEFSRDQIRAYQLKEFCEECNINKKLFINQFLKIGHEIIKNLDKVEVPPEANTKEERDFIHGLKDVIFSQTNIFLKCVPEITKIKV